VSSGDTFDLHLLREPAAQKIRGREIYREHALPIFRRDVDGPTPKLCSRTVHDNVGCTALVGDGPRQVGRASNIGKVLDETPGVPAAAANDGRDLFELVRRSAHKRDIGPCVRQAKSRRATESTSAACHDGDAA
jgi:hypothetical protein